MVTAHAPVPRTACMHSLALTSMLCSCLWPVALTPALPEPRYGGGPTWQLPGGVEGHQWALEHNGRGGAGARQCGRSLSTIKRWIHGVGGVSGTVGIVSGLVCAVGVGVDQQAGEGGGARHAEAYKTLGVCKGVKQGRREALCAMPDGTELYYAKV